MLFAVAFGEPVTVIPVIFDWVKVPTRKVARTTQRNNLFILLLRI